MESANFLYKDEDGDMISVCTDTELIDAYNQVEQMGQHSLKMIISGTKDSKMEPRLATQVPPMPSSGFMSANPNKNTAQPILSPHCAEAYQKF